MIHHICPQCGDDVMLSDEMGGKEYCCPSCEQSSQVCAAPPGPPQSAVPQQGPTPYQPQPQQQQPAVAGATPYQQQYAQGQDPGLAPQQGAYGVAQPQYAAPLCHQENAPGAVSSLVCGIVGMFCCGIVFGVIAIALASQAKSAIALNPGFYAGAGLATAGKVLGIIGLIFSIIFIIITITNPGPS